MTHSTTDVRAKLDEIVASGDDQALRAFLIEGFKELPEEMQKRVLFACFEEAIEKEAEIARIQETAIGVIQEIEAYKEALTKQG